MQKVFSVSQNKKAEITFRFGGVKWQNPFAPDVTHDITENRIHANFAFETKR